MRLREVGLQLGFRTDPKKTGEEEYGRNAASCIQDLPGRTQLTHLDEVFFNDDAKLPIILQLLPPCSGKIMRPG